MLQFNSGQHLENIAKWFKIEPQYIEKNKSGRFEHMLIYLIHKNDTTKFQYAPELVISNFDYVGFIQSGGTNARATDIVKDIMSGEITPLNIADKITPFEYHKNKRLITDTFEFKSKADRTIHRNMEVVFIRGDESGSGKTEVAKYIAKKKGFKNPFITGSSNDILQDYEGQDCIILDDMRCHNWHLADFIKMIDNYNDSGAKARFKNKRLTNCKLLFITGIKTIEDFYKSFGELDEPIKQLKRRCKTYLVVNKYSVKAYQYIEIKEDYEFVEEYPNPVIDLLQKAYTEKRTVEEMTNFLCLEPVKHIVGLNLKKCDDEFPFT